MLGRTGGGPPTQAHAAPLKLLFVHGRGQAGLNPADLKTTWLNTLSEGATAIGKQVPVNIEVAFPFYGDALDEFTRRSQLPLPSDIHSKGDARQDEFLKFQEQVAEEIRLREGITVEQVEEEYGANPKPKGPLNWEWVQAIIRAIDRHAPGLTQKSLESFTRDVYLYTTNFVVKDAIDAIVAKELTRQPTIVVGHSLGSVVAYNVLRSDENLSVPLYVSVGCPLGIRAIREQVRPVNHRSRWSLGTMPSTSATLSLFFRWTRTTFRLLRVSRTMTRWTTRLKIVTALSDTSTISLSLRESLARSGRRAALLATPYNGHRMTSRALPTFESIWDARTGPIPWMESLRCN